MSLPIEMAEASMSIADVDNIQAARKTLSKRTFWDTLSYGLAGVAGIAAILSMVWSGGALIYFAMSITLFLSSSVTVQRFRLSRQETFREVCNQVREEVNRLQVENTHLSRSIDDLEVQVMKLEKTEKELADIVTVQGTDTNVFVTQVKANACVQEEIQDLLVMDVMQNMVSAVMRADRDQDFTLDSDEMDAIVVRIKALPGVEGVDEVRIKEILLKEGSGLDAILEVVMDIYKEKKDPSRAVVQVSARKLVVPQ